MENLVPTIVTVAVTAGGAWENTQLPAGVCQFSVKCRTAVDLNLSFDNGTNWLVIPSGSSYNSPYGSYNKPTLYFDAASNVTAEIIYHKQP